MYLNAVVATVHNTVGMKNPQVLLDLRTDVFVERSELFLQQEVITPPLYSLIAH